MRKKLIIVFNILIIFILGCLYSPKANAVVNSTFSPEIVCTDTGSITLTFANDPPAENTFLKDTDYTVGFWGPNSDELDPLTAAYSVTAKTDDTTKYEAKVSLVGNNKLIWNWTTKDWDEVETKDNHNITTIGRWTYRLWKGKVPSDLNSGKVEIGSGQYVMLPSGICDGNKFPVISVNSPVQVQKPFKITVTNIEPSAKYIMWFNGDVKTLIDGTFANGLGGNGAVAVADTTTTDSAGKSITTATATFSNTQDYTGKRKLCLRFGETTIWHTGLAPCEMSVDIEVVNFEPKSSKVVESPSLLNIEGEETTIPALDEKTTSGCKKSKTGSCILNTALGEIDTDPLAFVQRIFGIVLGISGGIALILIILAGYKVMSSQGNPEAIKAATEQLTSAITGLLFIIFAFVILQIIGVDILRIPGFS